MMIKTINKVWILFFASMFMPFITSAQTQLVGVDYSGSAENLDANIDSIYVFCSADSSDVFNGVLQITSPFDTTSVFAWEKFDTVSLSFSSYPDGVMFDSVTSRQTGLGDGLYKVTVSAYGASRSYQAWVLHDWIMAQAEIPDSTSTCEGFQINASFTCSPMRYYSFSGDSMKTARNPEIKFKTQWFRNEDIEYSILSPYFVDPIASETDIDYKLVVTDMQFGCTGEVIAPYKSKVTDAKFAFDPQEGEAVLEVTFTNNSINYDSSYWFFSRELDEIKAEILADPTATVDSVDFVLTDDSPVYKYENSGYYRVYLVTVKENPTTGNCRDTIWMEEGEYIDVDTSDIQLPNVFTPNGDGVNDNYIIYARSLKSMEVFIYNRWGGLVHSWKYSNIQNSDYVYEHSVWDGRINGSYASPGVYVVVIKAEGRDGRTKKDHGFVHLFR